MTKNSDTTLVYSTDPIASSRNVTQNPPKSEQSTLGKKIARLSIERKGRGGKTVTLVGGLHGTPDNIADLASQLKKSCGTGGTVKDGILEIQGDHRATLTVKLKSLGYEVKGGI